MNGFRKLEIMVEELDESFNEHVVKSRSEYYYIIKSDGSGTPLKLNVYSRGGETECEILILPDYSSTSAAKCNIKVDGESRFCAQNVISIFSIPLKTGYHVLEFSSEGVAAGMRLRLTGALSDCKETAVNNEQQAAENSVENN